MIETNIVISAGHVTIVGNSRWSYFLIGIMQGSNPWLLRKTQGYPNR